MKIKLRAEKDIQILNISELDAPRNVDVLRAGVTQLFKNGKNRIILELNNAKIVPSEILRELGRLKLHANELAGDVVISGLDAETKTRIDSFAKPPFALSFGTTDQAIQHFTTPAKPAPEPAAASTAFAPKALSTPTASAPATGGAAHSAEAQVVQYKQDLRAKELGELGALKKQVESLKAENKSLTALLAQRIWDRREPPDVAGYKEKITELEGRLAEILSQPPEKKK